MGLERYITDLSSARKHAVHTIISTKLQIPPLRAEMLPRQRLVDRLTAGKYCRLILISGEAGSGKTSLVCQWIDKYKLPVAWYSLDKADNESDLFFRHLLAAVAPWLKEQKRFPRTEVVPFLVRRLIDLPKDVYLVLDDYHVITSRKIHEVLLCLLTYMPPKMHISRRSIPFPLSHLKLRNQMMIISAEDLRFTEKETEQFFTEIIPVRLCVEDVHELSQYTEGWVGSLQLFGLTLKEKDTLEGFSDLLHKACQETTDYLIDEVITVQPKKVKVFLHRTALLDRFNIGLCQEVAGVANSQEILDYIYRNNLFLIPLNSERTWYRYHHLLSEAIRKQVKMSSNTFREVHRKAAIWFAKNDYLEDAFRHAFASGDLEFAADMLENYLFLLYARYEVASSFRWLAKLPNEILMQRPLLRLYECCFNIESFQLLDIEPTLTDIEAHQTGAFERYEGVKRNSARIYSHTSNIFSLITETL